MTIPSRVERIAHEIGATVSPNDRAALGVYLKGIETSEELFGRCIKKAIQKLERFNAQDAEWLKKWLPIIFRKIHSPE